MQIVLLEHFEGKLPTSQNVELKETIPFTLQHYKYLVSIYIFLKVLRQQFTHHSHLSHFYDVNWGPPVVNFPQRWILLALARPKAPSIEHKLSLNPILCDES